MSTLALPACHVVHIVGLSIKETLNKLIPLRARHAHHERDQALAVHPAPVGFAQDRFVERLVQHSPSLSEGIGFCCPGYAEAIEH